MKMFFYHFPCLDGLTAAWCARYYCELLGYEYKFIQYDHKNIESIDFFQCEDQEVYFLDCSPKLDKLQKLLEIAKSVIILDHHFSNMESLKDFDHEKLTKIFNMDNSGAMMSYLYFIQGLVWDKMPSMRGGSVPEFIKYVEDNDMWWNKKSQIKDFMAWIDYENPQGLSTIDWMMATFEDSVEREKIFSKGRMLNQFKQSLIDAAKQNAYKGLIDGIEFIIVNSACWQLNSEIGNQLVKEYNLPAAVWYETVNDKGKRVKKYSLRSVPHLLDVSKVAEKFGGAGHKAASGFFIDAE